MLGRCHISHYSEYVLSSTLLIYSALIAIVLGNYDANFYIIIDFYSFYDGAVDIHIWALLTRNQSRVSDTQVTVMACGPLLMAKVWAYTLELSCKSVFTSVVFAHICENIIASTYTVYPKSMLKSTIHVVRKYKVYDWILIWYKVYPIYILISRVCMYYICS